MDTIALKDMTGVRAAVDAFNDAREALVTLVADIEAAGTAAATWTNPMADYRNTAVALANTLNRAFVTVQLTDLNTSFRGVATADRAAVVTSMRLITLSARPGTGETLAVGTAGTHVRGRNADEMNTIFSAANWALFTNATATTQTYAVPGFGIADPGVLIGSEGTIVNAAPAIAAAAEWAEVSALFTAMGSGASRTAMLTRVGIAGTNAEAIDLAASRSAQMRAVIASIATGVDFPVPATAEQIAAETARSNLQTQLNGLANLFAAAGTAGGPATLTASGGVTGQDTPLTEAQILLGGAMLTEQQVRDFNATTWTARTLVGTAYLAATPAGMLQVCVDNQCNGTAGHGTNPCDAPIAGDPFVAGVAWTPSSALTYALTAFNTAMTALAASNV
jgi:hypothetical protein